MTSVSDTNDKLITTQPQSMAASDTKQSPSGSQGNSVAADGATDKTERFKCCYTNTELSRCIQCMMCGFVDTAFDGVCAAAETMVK